MNKNPDFLRKQRAFHNNPDINPDTGGKLIYGKGPYNKFVEKYGDPSPNTAAVNVIYVKPSLNNPTYFRQLPTNRLNTVLISPRIINDDSFTNDDELSIIKEVNTDRSDNSISLSEELWSNRLDDPAAMNDRSANNITLINQDVDYFSVEPDFLDKYMY